MIIRLITIFFLNLLLGCFYLNPVFALEHSQRDGLLSMDIPKDWHWEEFSQEIVITYPDGQSAAIDIQWLPNHLISLDDIKKTLKEGNERMIKEGIEPHQGKLIENKEITIDGVYATELEFKSGPDNPVDVSYISFINKGNAFTITYGSRDENMRLLMDDAVSTIKFN